MTEQLLDLKGILRFLRRAWRALAIVALLGALVGGVYGYSRPPSFTAKALVLLPNATVSTGSGAGPNTVTTDARIATSAAVLVPAGRQVDPSLSSSQLEARVRASAANTASVLAITAAGPDRQEAEDLVNAVAAHLVSFVTSTASTSASATMTQLQNQVKGLSGQLATVQAEIHTVDLRLGAETTTSDAGRQDTNLLQDYTAEQTSLQLQLNSTQAQISQTELQQVSANQGTQVIEKATSASSSRGRSIGLKAGIGLLLGLLGSSVVVVARHRKEPRLYTRDALARALGAPVVLSLPAEIGRSGNAWLELLARYEPQSAEQWNVRKALRELEVVDGPSARLDIWILEGDAPAAALAAKVAVAASASRIDTAFSFIDHGSLPALRSACLRIGQRDEYPRPDLEVLADEECSGSPRSLTVVARTVDPLHPVAGQARTETVTVLAVSAGTATADQLARVAIAAADVGAPIRATLVANPVGDDDTTGRFPDGSPRATLVLSRQTLGSSTARRRQGSTRLSPAGAVAGPSLPSDQRLP